MRNLFQQKLTKQQILTNLMLLNVIFMLTAIAASETSRRNEFTRKDCNDIKALNTCHCRGLPSVQIPSFLILCPANATADDELFKVTMFNNYMEIKCRAHDVDIYQWLPTLWSGVRNHLAIERCNRLGQARFAELLKRWRLIETEELDYSEVDFGSGLERPQLSDLTQLKRLYLTSSNITQLPLDLFTDLLSLVYLDLSRNLLTQLHADVFRPLKNLITLNLGDNKLKQLSADIFRHNVQLQQLDLADNKLERLDPDIVSALSQLRSIELSGNNFSVLPATLFAHNKQLDSFYLARNGKVMQTLPQALLANLPKLSFIYCRSKFEFLPVDLFTNSSAIKHVDLSLCGLKELPVGLLEQQLVLSGLHLSSNRLQVLPVEILKLPLMLLSIDDNDMDEHFLPAAVLDEATNMTRVTQLDGRRNKFSVLDERLLRFFAAYSDNVDLRANRIARVELKSLDFLHNVSPNVSSLLELANNPFNCDCQLLNFVRLLRGEFDSSPFKSILRFDIADLKCARPASLRGKQLLALNPLELLCRLGTTSNTNSSEAGCPPSCNCWLRPYDSTLLVNCSRLALQVVPALPTPASNALQHMQLNLAHNNLSELPPTLLNLTRLDLRHNHFRHLSAATLSALANSSLYLSHNAWVCDCAALPLFEFVRDNFKRIADLDDLHCNYAGEARALAELSPAELCPPGKWLQVTLIFVSLVCFTLTITALYLWYEPLIKIWLYAHGWCLCCVTEAEADSDRLYDAFISYSHYDMPFLAEHLVPQLEQDPHAFKLCIDVRNWLAGETIPECIARSIEQSRRTIVVLSSNFIKSSWSRMEFRTAHTAALTEQRARVIVIIYGDIGDFEELDQELQVYLRINIYLRWGEQFFWEKLRYAMPHSSHKRDGAQANDIDLGVLARRENGT